MTYLHIIIVFLELIFTKKITFSVSGLDLGTSYLYI